MKDTWGFLQTRPAWFRAERLFCLHCDGFNGLHLYFFLFKVLFSSSTIQSFEYEEQRLESLSLLYLHALASVWMKNSCRSVWRTRMNQSLLGWPGRNSWDSWNIRHQNPKGQGRWKVLSVPLSGVQGDDKFATKGRTVLDSHFLEHLQRDAYVAQVNSAGSFSQRKREAKRQRPLGFDRVTLPAHRRIQAKHRCSVLIGPVCSRPVPRLIHQERVLMAVQAVYDEINRGVGKIYRNKIQNITSWLADWFPDNQI